MIKELLKKERSANALKAARLETSVAVRTHRLYVNILPKKNGTRA